MKTALPLLVALVVAAPTVTVAHAQSELTDRVRLFVDSEALPGGGDVEVTVGEPDPRLQLAPCRSYEPFVPPGARLWGRTSLGVRCVEGARWTIYLPTQVRVYAQAAVAARALPRNQLLGPDDVRLERVELTALPPGAAFVGELPDGRMTTRALAAGEPLRREFLRLPPVVQAGDAVSIHAGGRGFEIVTEGKALATATEGQSVQVAIAGKVLTGTARSGKIVEVR